MITVDNIMGYKATWWGIIRIAFWVAFFLTAASLYLPSAPENVPFEASPRNPRLRLTATIAEDPRFMLKLPRQEGINIAWITDSSGAVFPADKYVAEAEYKDTKLIPSLALDRLQKLARTDNIGVDLSIQPGLRSLENYSSVAAAIESKPDMIVLSFNPFWLLNGYEIHKRRAHLNRASGLWAEHPPAWPWLLTLASPANNLWTALGSKYAIISDMSLYKGRIEAMLPRFPTPQAANKPAEQEDRVQLIKSNVVFWVCYGALREKCLPIVKPTGGVDNKLWYREMLKLSDLQSYGMARDIWQKTLDMLAHSGIPTYIYMMPSGPDVKLDDAAYEKLQEMEKLLELSADRYKDTNVHITPRIPPDVLRTMKFRPDDSAHVITQGKFDHYLAQQIWHIIEQDKVGKQ